MVPPLWDLFPLVGERTLGALNRASLSKGGSGRMEKVSST